MQKKGWSSLKSRRGKYHSDTSAGAERGEAAAGGRTVHAAVGYWNAHDMAEEDSKPNRQRRQDLRPASAPASQEEPLQQVCGTRQGSMSSGWGGLAQQCIARSKHPQTQRAAATQRVSSGVKRMP